MLLENSTFMEVLYEFLVSDLKKERVSVINRNDDEECESVEKAHEAIENNIDMVNDKCNVEKMQNSYVGRSVKGKHAAELTNEKIKSEDEVVQQTTKEIREKECKGDESLSEHDVDSSEEDSEHECGDHVGKLHDG